MSLTSSSNFSKNNIGFTFRVKSSLLMKALRNFETSGNIRPNKQRHVWSNHSWESCVNWFYIFW